MHPRAPQRRGVCGLTFVTTSTINTVCISIARRCPHGSPPLFALEQAHPTTSPLVVRRLDSPEAVTSSGRWAGLLTFSCRSTKATHLYVTPCVSQNPNHQRMAFREDAVSSGLRPQYPRPESLFQLPQFRSEDVRDRMMSQTLGVEHHS